MSLKFYFHFQKQLVKNVKNSMKSSWNFELDLFPGREPVTTTQKLADIMLFNAKTKVASEYLLREG